MALSEVLDNLDFLEERAGEGPVPKKLPEMSLRMTLTGTMLVSTSGVKCLFRGWKTWAGQRGAPGGHDVDNNLMLSEGLVLGVERSQSQDPVPCRFIKKVRYDIYHLFVS